MFFHLIHFMKYGQDIITNNIILDSLRLVLGKLYRHSNNSFDRFFFKFIYLSSASMVISFYYIYALTYINFFFPLIHNKYVMCRSS